MTANGSRYDYIVFEGKTTWRPQYSTTTDADGNTVRVIYNRPIPGAGQSILLRKRWLDDGDEQHRGTITFTIYEIPVGKENSITPELLQEAGVEVAKTTLSRSDEWWKQVSLDAGVDLNRLLVLETGVAATDGNGKAVTLQYTAKELQAIYALQHGEAESPIKAYETYYHQYEASYSMVDFEGNTFYTVTNRRLGNIDIKVTKTWHDGSTETQTETQISQKRKDFLNAIKTAGYQLVFKLEATSPDVTVNYENNTVTAGNKEVQILDAAGQQAAAIQKISTDTNTSSYEFYNLPKYDANGQLVSYTVKEMLQPLRGNGTAEELKPITEVIKEKQIDTDYTFSMTQSGYTVQHGQNKHDLQTFSAVNALTGSKDVFFWKEWNDAYRFQLGERPDIYLSLYQVKHNEDGTEKAPVSVYLDRRWQFRDDWISLCDFGAMPKYDEYGFEIIYYAQEKILVNKYDFDYTDVYYKYSDQMEDRDVLAGAQLTAQDDLNAFVDALTKIGDETGAVDGSGAPQNALKKNTDGVYLLKEYGIFVNELQADVHVSGKKIWANVDAGYPDADLPTVTFKLYRYHPVDDKDSIPDPNTSDSSAFDDKHEVAKLTVDDWESHKIVGEYLFELAYTGVNTNKAEDGDIVVESEADETQLPKYDEDGYLYTYILRETANFASTDARDVGLVFKQPTINNYAITNAYNSVLGEISIKKILDLTKFDDKDADIQNPSVSFTLTRSYRSYKNAQGVLTEDKTFRETQIMPYDTFENNAAEITFDALELYAPNGAKYVYTVTENTGDSELLKGGYTVYADNGQWASVTQDDDHQTVSVTNLYPRQTTPEPDPELTDDQINASWATFENVYKKNPVPLYFSKNWVDGNNEFNTRLDTLTFDVKRSADAQPGQGNAIAEYLIGSMTITVPLSEESVTLTPGNGLTFADPDSYLVKMVESVTVMTQEAQNNAADPKTLKTTARWVFEVEFVDAYAPNGMPWKYKISEHTDNIAPYTSTTTSIMVYYSAANNDFSSASANITNTLNTSATFWKNWRRSTKDYTSIKNPFGYAITLTTTLYAAGVKVEDPTQAPNANEYNDVSLWEPVQEGSKYWDALVRYVGENNKNNLKKSITYQKNAELGAREGALSIMYNNLPTVIQINGEHYYMKYYAIETEFALTEGGEKIYRETFTPHFELYDDLNAEYKKFGGTSRIGYWLEPSAEVLNGDDNWVETEEFLVKPAVSTKETLDAVHKNGLSALYNTATDLVTDPAIYPFINFYTHNTASKREATGVNLIDLTQLRATKTWVNDNDNIYGARDDDASNGWSITMALQRRKLQGSDADWKTFDTREISGANTDKTDSITETDLPVRRIVANDSGGYTVEKYEYRAREIYNENTVENGQTYRETYQAAYTDDGDQEDGYTTEATNTLQTVKLYAQKTWENDLAGNLTFELKYTDANGALQSFATPAVVELDGEQDTPDAQDVYYENEAWHAVWTDVPQVMPGSKTEERADGEKYTIYKVVEVSENAYQTGETTGTGTQTNPFVFTNELTELRVEKTVEKYVEGAVVPNVFEFKIEGDFEDITVYYQTFTKGTGGAADEPEGSELTLQPGGAFTLADNQYVIFYGLKKGKTYTITETKTHGYTPAFTVTKADGTTEKTNAVTLPDTKPANTPRLTVLNQYLGKLTVEKKDENGNALGGVTFRLQVFDETIGTSGDWRDVETKTTDSTNGTNGCVVFKDLKLDKKYQILEDSVPAGYHKMANPIQIDLPLKSSVNPGGSNPLYTIDGDYYYAEVTVTVENNRALAMPTTSGEGFFWPGLVGLAVLAFGAGYGFFTGRRRRRKGA